MSPTRRELVEATRERILAAADRLMRTRGPQGFSMDVLAQEAGVARATVYEHFRSKRTVLDALASAASIRISLDGQVGTGSEPLVALRDTLGAVCRHWAEHEDQAKQLHALAAVTGGEAADAIDDAHLRRLVDAVAAAGQLRARWTTDEATAALAVLTSYPTYERLRRAGARTPAQVEALLVKLVVSIVSPNPQPAPA